jgi:PAS domain S-box-containing protein
VASHKNKKSRPKAGGSHAKPLDAASQRLYEKSLDYERELAQRYLELAGTIILSLDRLGRVILINKKGCEILGQRPNQIIGRDWFGNFLPKRHRAKAKKVFNGLVRGRVKHYEYFENEVLRKDGTERLIAWHNTMLRDDKGRLTGLLSSGEDITEKRRAEFELKEKLGFIQNLVHTIPDVIFEVDNKGYFTFVSDAVKQFGYEASELTGEHFKSVVHPDDYIEAARIIVLPKYRGMITGDERSPKLFDERRTEARCTRNLEVRIRYKGSDEYCYVDMNSSGKWDAPVGVPRRKLIGSIGVIRNATARKEYEEGMLEARRQLEQKNVELRKLDELKSEFVSTVSHELRTPLSIVKEGMSIVLDDVVGEINEKQRKILGTAKDNVDRLARIINEILDISKIEAGRLELRKTEFDACDLIRRMVSFFTQKAKRVEFRADLTSTPVIVYADEDKIAQVLTNLMGNSLKFTESGFIEVSCRERKRDVIFMVKDTGKGISKANLSKLFKKFEQFDRATGAGDKGTGLGLTISKAIVELHGGRVDVESQPGKGSVFIFTLPKFSKSEIARNRIEYELSHLTKISKAVSVMAVKASGSGPATRAAQIVGGLQKAISGVLRYGGDGAYPMDNRVVVILTNCTKLDAEKVWPRIEGAINGYLEQNGLRPDIVETMKVSYPEDASDAKKIIEMVLS